MTLNPELLQATSLPGYVLVFLGGIITSIGPCNVAMIPLVVAFVGTSPVWLYLVAGVCIAIGLQMLGVVSIPMPAWFASVRERVTLKGLPGALLLGLVSGLVASQCATPVLAAIITYVLASQSALLYGAALLFIYYALGRGVPVILAGTFAGVLKQLRSLGKWSHAIERTSGLIMLGVGLYFVWMV